MKMEPTLARRAVVAGFGALAISEASQAGSSGAEGAISMRGILTSYAQAWERGDVAALAAFYHDDFTLHYPGRHSLAGTHQGKPEALRILREVSRRTNRRLVAVTDIMVGTHRGCLDVTEEWTRAAKTERIERLLVYTVRDAKLDHCWLFDSDQELVAQFLADL
jgi:hypothetical protein